MANTSLVDGHVNLIDAKTRLPIRVTGANVALVAHVFRLATNFGYTTKANFYDNREESAVHTDLSVESFALNMVSKEVSEISFSSAGRWSFEDTLNEESGEKLQLKQLLIDNGMDLEFHYDDEMSADFEASLAYSVLNGPIKIEERSVYHDIVELAKQRLEVKIQQGPISKVGSNPVFVYEPYSEKLAEFDKGVPTELLNIVQELSGLHSDYLSCYKKATNLISKGLLTEKQIETFLPLNEPPKILNYHIYSALNAFENGELNNDLVLITLLNIKNGKMYGPFLNSYNRVQNELNEGSFKVVSLEEILQVIKSREPKGSYICVEGDKFIGVDSRLGVTRTEAFTTFQECTSFLYGVDVNDPEIEDKTICENSIANRMLDAQEKADKQSPKISKPVEKTR